METQTASDRESTGDGCHRGRSVVFLFRCTRRFATCSRRFEWTLLREIRSLKCQLFFQRRVRDWWVWGVDSRKQIHGRKTRNILRPGTFFVLTMAQLQHQPVPHSRSSKKKNNSLGPRSYGAKPQNPQQLRSLEWNQWSSPHHSPPSTAQSEPGGPAAPVRAGTVSSLGLFLGEPVARHEPGQLHLGRPRCAERKARRAAGTGPKRNKESKAPAPHSSISGV